MKNKDLKSRLKERIESIQTRVPNSRVADFFITQLWAVAQRRTILNPFDPKTFADLTFRVNLFQRDTLRKKTANKASAKEWIAETVGADYVIPTVTVLLAVEELNKKELADELPLIAKPSHGADDVFWLRSTDDLSQELEQFVRRCVGRPYSRVGRQAIYKTESPSVIFERDIGGGAPLDDYKVHCIRGVPVLIQHDMDRWAAHTQTYYTREWNRLAVNVFDFMESQEADAPPALNEMLEVARTLAEPFDYVRVDLYQNEERIYVGEITHVPWSSRNDFSSPAFSRLLVDFWRGDVSLDEFDKLVLEFQPS